MPISIQYILVGAIVLLLAYNFQQQRKIARLSEVTQNKETLSWVDYKGHRYNIEINREVHSGSS